MAALPHPGIGFPMSALLVAAHQVHCPHGYLVSGVMPAVDTMPPETVSFGSREPTVPPSAVPVAVYLVAASSLIRRT